ncbi:MAG: bacillithiol system redox-active protein YtxJ [Bacteroidota bacterium]|nr:bacillithiol system redox-active protein YtxJ [Bacteroidota bacterium]
MNWIEITDASTINELKLESEQHPDKVFVIFKHSTRCGTSRMAKNLFESEWTIPLPVHLVNIVESRMVSNSISSAFMVQHESPQVLVIKKGSSIYNNSHSYINAAEILELIALKPS